MEYIEGKLLKRIQSKLVENATGTAFWGVVVVDLGNGKEIKVKGTSPILGINGDYVRAMGKTENTNWGQQFAAETLSIDLPHAPRDCVDRLILLSEFIPGMGAKTAKTIYDESPDTIWERLAITTNKATKEETEKESRFLPALRTAFAELQTERGANASPSSATDITFNLQRFLSGLNIKWTKMQVANTVAFFGNKTMDIVQNGPALIGLLDVPEIGYQTVRSLADALDLTDEAKARIVVIGKLIEVGKDGHICYPIDQFTIRFEKLTGAASITDTIAQLKAEGHVAIYKDHIYQTKSLEQEQYIAQRLLALQDSGIGKAVEATPAQSTTLASAQLLALASAQQRGLTIINGAAGTGKTSLLREIVASEDIAAHILLLAPTGKAAKRMADVVGRETMTIHRFLALQVALECAPPSHYDMVVVDEMSMVYNEIFYKLLHTLDTRCHCPSLRLVLLGDYNQLPSISPGQLLTEITAAPALQPSLITLTQVFRQQPTTTGLSKALEDILAGIAPTTDIKGGFTWMATDDQKKIEEALKVRATKYADTLDKMWVMSPMNLHVDRYNTLIRAIVNPPKEDVEETKQNKNTPHPSITAKQFRVGDRIIQLANNYDLSVFNGSTGVVRKIKDKLTRKCGLSCPIRTLAIEFEGERMVDYPAELAERQLKLAYATTCHKAQGSEVDYAVVILPNASDMVDRRLLYTAISRAKEKCILIGSRRTVEAAVAQEAKTRYSCISQMLLL